MVIAIAKYFGWPLDQLDVVTAFLYGIMKELVFCAVPEGVDLDGDFDCLELVKAIYGLKQASRVCDGRYGSWTRSLYEAEGGTSQTVGPERRPLEGEKEDSKVID
ncbi:hypothetical protein PC113_g25797 [Phytophthora cactorum]|uniref:Reverse transcriptase Ty1/copia-type domain-containing protein n=1 Tax=Phytophthora cactorum TaxID=29920 RepID=A0A8T0Y0Y8_9STRA|nr:hypothetical protein PC113_g25797 [Phytophthora cactorum]